MPVPPPPPAPPPPAPPPPLASSQGRSAPPKLKQETGGGGGRSALLSDIQKGARLKKVTEVNDRSAPVIENAKKNGGTGNNRSAVAPPTGGLFAGGFPVLKPSNQRDATGNKSALQLPGMKGSVPKLPDQVPPKTDHPKPIPHTVAARPPPPRPTILGRLSPVPPPIPQAPPPIPQVPPPIPPSSSKPQLMPSSPIPSTFKERPAKPTGGSNGPPSPVNSQDKSKLQRPQSQFFPSTPPPPLPPYPPPTLPPGYPGRRSPSPSVPDGRDHSGLPPPPLPSVPSRLEDFIPPPPDIRDLPPPPPPPPLHPMSMSTKRRLSEPLPPPPVFGNECTNVPPRPQKGPSGRPAVPPVPVYGRPNKPAGNNGGRLAPPPPPPARSPSTELSSRQPGNQQAPNRSSAQPGYRPPSPRNVHSLDFESKFPFHPVEDLPPPEVYEPFEKVYPSKCNYAPSAPKLQFPQMR
ncbi:WAS/WASL-interacting protein family member 3 isoform X2 [Ranitomeya variabilis]|uniref:WAS/WASL-interacting protein family member 3 isoform X2 n=1 Tax=Ranitomeya variabilis TaxID=490064 RepID=UPI0040576E4B